MRNAIAYSFAAFFVASCACVILCLYGGATLSTALAVASSFGFADAPGTHPALLTTLRGCCLTSMLAFSALLIACGIRAIGALTRLLKRILSTDTHAAFRIANRVDRQR
jgi:hypothetical protein